MRKKPWNIIGSPIYSLVTRQGDRFNMNICTYVTALSMQPKLYGVCVYDGTLSQMNIKNSEVAVLQILGKNQISVVKQLGFKSGIQFNKQAWLEKNKWLEEWQGFQVLKGTAACLLLKKTGAVQTGDHLLCLFEVLHHQTHSLDVMMLNDLREHKLIRI